MKNLAGFERVDSVPDPIAGSGRKGHSKYNELIKEVREEGNIYAIDMGNKQHAYSLAVSMRKLLRRRGIDDVIVSVRGIKVYVSRKED